MKKLLVFLLCLSSTMLFAQSTDLHYVINELGVQGTHLSVTGVLTIDGVEVYNGEGQHDAGGEWLEIGVFDQDGECRGAKFPTWRAKSNQWIYQLKLRGDNGFTYPVWKIYDHATETEWTYEIDLGEVIEFEAGGKIGSVTAPYAINFTNGGGATFTLNITGYGDSNGGYYLIASPIDGADPAESEMLATPESDYDLFRFNQAGAEGEWENYKKEGEHYHFNLEAGRGYLYAHKTGTTITVTGTPYTGNGEFDLDYVDGAACAGFNLVGNPFGGEADVDRPYYKLDEETRSYFAPTLESGTLGLMEGVLVQATEPGQKVKFTAVLGGKRGNDIASANVVLSSNGNAIDKAIVRFDGGMGLGKYQMNNSSKIYFPQENAEYAIANAETNEMPLNFKAETAGTYTISIKLNSSNIGYLHLIDKLTGEDVNLFTTPEYSFVGSPRDAENRFIVRFYETSANDTFVYQYGSELIVNGEGTLQVFDVMGRFVGSYEVNGSERISADQFANAVYVFRMIGNDVKTQKIVVR